MLINIAMEFGGLLAVIIAITNQRVSCHSMWADRGSFDDHDDSHLAVETGINAVRSSINEWPMLLGRDIMLYYNKYITKECMYIHTCSFYLLCYLSVISFHIFFNIIF